ncbi:MAG TPA: hypothetical protein VKY38_02425 [Azoarcus sp.]|nr:hypothetical protein [Azoarcus sp.]
MATKRIRKKFVVLCDEEKLRQTSHWDMDLLSREQIDALYAAPEKKPSASDKGKASEHKDEPDDQ